MRKKINNAIKKMKFIRRELVVFLIFILAFLIIISKVFSYTVLHYSYYKDLADKQQIGKIETPVTRGNIYTKNPNILANSVSLNNLAIDPNPPYGNEAKLIIFLRNIIYSEICENKTENDCKNNLEKFLKVLDLEDFKYDKEYILEKITENLAKKVDEKNVTSVLVENELDEKSITNLKALNLKGVYINENKLYINPEEVENIDSLSEILTKNTQIIEGRIKKLIKKRKKRYTPIIKKLSIESSQKLNDYIYEEIDALKRGIINKEDTIFNFIILEPIPRRNYPEKKLASQVVGFVDNSGKGQYGLEGYFDDILKGNKGYILAKVDIKGNTIDPIKFKSNMYGKGAKIYSTIDRNIQAKVEKFLEEGVKKFKANKGTVVVMNPQTGEITAMANYPSFDPNNPGKVYELEKVSYAKYRDPLIDLKGYPVFVEDSKNGKEYYYNSKKILLRKATIEELGNPAIIKYKFKNGFGPEVYRNGAISDLYEPGSIMKAFTVAIGLDSGEITENSMYQDNGSVTIDQFKISNVSSKCLGYHTYGHALNYSCNVGMLRIAQRYGKVLAYEYLNNFGFGKKTNISLAGEVSSQIRELNHWSTSNLLTSSYGLGVSVTPLQMAAAYSVLANGGIYIKPHIIDKIIYPNGKTLKYKKEEKARVLKPETSRIITKMLVNSIQNGVAKKGNVEGYNLAGKTGTSQIASKGGYEKGQASTHASFAGFGPAEDPKFVIIVKLDRPRTSIYGGVTSAEIFRNIASFLLDYYKIPKKDLKKEG